MNIQRQVLSDARNSGVAEAQQPRLENWSENAHEYKNGEDASAPVQALWQESWGAKLIEFQWVKAQMGFLLFFAVIFWLPMLTAYFKDEPYEIYQIACYIIGSLMFCKAVVLFSELGDMAEGADGNESLERPVALLG